MGMAAGCAAYARVCVDEAMAYAQQRETFGKKIAEHQGILFRLADMATMVEASHQMMVKAARLKDASRTLTIEPRLTQQLLADIDATRVEALAEQVKRSGRPMSPEMEGQLKDEVIAREIFMQEAQKLSLDTTADFKNQMELARQTILIRELFGDFQKKNPVTEEEMKAEYDKFAAQNSGKEFKARHILVEKESEATDIIAKIRPVSLPQPQHAKCRLDDSETSREPEQPEAEFGDHDVKLPDLCILPSSSGGM